MGVWFSVSGVWFNVLGVWFNVFVKRFSLFAKKPNVFVVFLCIAVPSFRATDMSALNPAPNTLNHPAYHLD